MKIVFISNYLNHHQKPLSDELYHLTNGNYWFIATAPMKEERRLLGYKDIETPYLINCFNESAPNSEVKSIIDEADAVIIGSAPDAYVKERNAKHKLVFKYSERLYRSNPGILRLIAHRIRFRRNYDRNPNCYLLCASAFTAYDYNRIGCFRDKSFKWGYFPQVADIDIDGILAAKQGRPTVKILWVSRFLDWKHPELPVLIARQLILSGVNFELNMYGIGPEYTRIEALVSELNLGGKIHLMGAAPNNNIIDAMRSHDIFLFTSDRNEGWGAVANEAMSNGCTLIASDAIGSTDYLIRHAVNGLKFENCNSDDLLEKVLYLINNPDRRAEMARTAYYSMKNTWSPANAAKSLIELIDNLASGCDTMEGEAPCSKA